MHECIGRDGQMARTEEEYYELLERIEQLWESPVGSPEGAELDALVERILQYETFVFPVPPRPSRPLPRPEDFPPDAGVTELDIELFGPGIDRAIDRFRAYQAKIVCQGIRAQARRRLAEAGGSAPTMEPVPRRRPEGY